MPIKLNEETHVYTRKNIQYTSVTTVLQKYNLTANYDGIPKAIMERAAAVGKAVHKSLESYIIGTDDGSPEVKLFKTYVQTRGIDLNLAKAEEMVFDDIYQIAGTVDFQYEENGERIIADFKTTSQIHYNAVSWQLSIYNYLISQGDPLTYYFTKIKVYHFTKTGKLTVKDLALIDYDHVKALLDAHKDNKPDFVYVPIYNIIGKAEEDLLTDLVQERNKYKEALKVIEEKIDEVVDKVKENMINQSVHQYVSTDLIYTYVSPSTQNRLDTKKAREKLIEIGEDIKDYIKVTPTKDSLKMSPRKGGGDSEIL